MNLHHTPDRARPVGRAGYTAKGVVYAIVGFSAAQVTLGQGGKTTGSKGAIQETGQQPYGQVLLVLVGIGLACFAFWRFLSALVDAEGKGSDAQGIAERVGYFMSALAHVGLSVAAFSAIGGGSGGGGEGSTQSMTAKAISAPFGQWLVIAAGIAVAAAGIGQRMQLAQGRYRQRFDLEGAAAAQRQWIERAAKLGLAARGVVFLLIGFFLVQAGWQADSSEAQGLGGALSALAQQPYGPWLLGVTALGLICYRIYCGVIALNASFRRA